jgi:hypothetical protein
MPILGKRNSPSKTSVDDGSDPPSGADDGGQGRGKKKRAADDVNRRHHVPLFAFDAAGEEEGEEGRRRPKRRLKSTRRFDPTSYARGEGDGTRCRAGYGFACPGCSGVNSYDSTSCIECGLECRYEAGVGVVTVRDRRISYHGRPAAGNDHRPPTRRRTGREGAGGSAGSATAAGPSAAAIADGIPDREEDDDDGDDVSPAPRPPPPRDGRGEDPGGIRDGAPRGCEYAGGRVGGGGGGVFSGSGGSLAAGGGGRAAGDAGERERSAVAPSGEEDARGTTSGGVRTTKTPPPGDGGRGSCEDRVAAEEDRPGPPSLHADAGFCHELKLQLLALQARYDSVLPMLDSVEAEFRANASSLGGTILRRDRDAAALGEKISSSRARMLEVTKEVASLANERDEFAMRAKSRGL